MKGLVRRVLSDAQVWNRQLVVGRARASMFPERRFRICTWCWDVVDEPRKRYWHTHCAIWRLASTARLTPYEARMGAPIPPRTVGDKGWADYFARWDLRRCASCGIDGRLEIDHELPIAVAVELGPQAIMRAFLPENLQYLCVPCHRDKTKHDMAVLRYLRHGPPVSRPLPASKPAPVPLFDWAGLDL